MNMLDSGAYELVTYNSCYGGGPHLSEKGQQLLTPCVATNQALQKVFWSLELKVTNELGVEVASDKFSQLAFVLVRKGLRKYVNLNEYDGLEDPSVSLSRMIMGEVKRVLEAQGVLTKEEYDVIESTDIDRC
jgi:hypothetical protein